jgi:hypothetical protein
MRPYDPPGSVRLPRQIVRLDSLDEEDFEPEPRGFALAAAEVGRRQSSERMSLADPLSQPAR